MKDQLHRSATLFFSSAFVATGVGLAMYALSQEGARAAAYALCAGALLVAAALGLGRRIADWRLRSAKVPPWTMPHRAWSSLFLALRQCSAQ